MLSEKQQAMVALFEQHVAPSSKAISTPPWPQ
jgi:hypothetical protein